MFFFSLNNFSLNKVIYLTGWIHNLRFHGDYLFFNLKNRDFNFQIISNKKNLNFLKFGSFIRLVVVIIKREIININLFNYCGDLEFFLLSLFIFNFYSLSLNYKKFILNNFFINSYIFKSFFIKLFLLFFFFEKFFFLETPLFDKFYSEGSKVYLIPKKNNTFFFLSQSPQIFKQLFMIFNFERYFQISKCFRNEDLRSDRLLEFIQFDFEISFINNLDFLFFLKNFFLYLIFKIFNIFNLNFCILSYKKSLKNFFSDKPDLRFKELFFNFYFFYYLLFLTKNNFFIFFVFNFLFILGKNFINYLFLIKIFSFFFIFFLNNFFYLNIFFSLFFVNIFLFELFSLIKIKKNFLSILFLCFFNFFLKNQFKLFFLNVFYVNYNFLFLFLINFPLFNYNFILNKYNFLTNPFSKILFFDFIFLDISPSKVYCKSYDIILNGIEIGGGSVRNEKSFLQKKIFLIIFNYFEIYYNFNFFLNFLKNSTPQHCGAALGLDRIVSIFIGVKDLKRISIFNFRNFLKTPNFLI